jgi:hypothetical protein
VKEKTETMSRMICRALSRQQEGFLYEGGVCVFLRLATSSKLLESFD